MNNKDKSQYLSNLNIYRTSTFTIELEKKREFLANMPRVLYKYKKLDKYAFDILEKSYAFLAPVEGLDDPFDCLSDLEVDGIQKTKSKPITLFMIDHVIATVSKLGNVSVDKRELRKIVQNSFVDGTFNIEKFYKLTEKYPKLSEIEKAILSTVLLNIEPMLSEISKDDGLIQIAATVKNAQHDVGVCSLSTKRDNKVMWSLYGDEYNGCCIEYTIPNHDDIRFNLCPVLYKRHSNNNFVMRMVEFVIANTLRYYSQGQLSRGVGAINELLCTKDVDWAFQDEWRLLGKPNEKNYLLKIKAVYLGYKTSKFKVEKIKKIAKANKYDVFLMDRPSGKSKIIYTKIC